MVGVKPLGNLDDNVRRDTSSSSSSARVADRKALLESIARDAFSLFVSQPPHEHANDVARSAPSRRRRFRFMLSPGDVCETSCARVRCSRPGVHARPVTTIRHARVAHQGRAELRELLTFARSNSCGFSPPASGVVARRAGSRLDHLLRRHDRP